MNQTWIELKRRSDGERIRFYFDTSTFRTHIHNDDISNEMTVVFVCLRCVCTAYYFFALQSPLAQGQITEYGRFHFIINANIGIASYFHQLQTNRTFLFFVARHVHYEV